MLTDGWADTGGIGVLIAHLGDFGSGELKSKKSYVDAGWPTD